MFSTVFWYQFLVIVLTGSREMLLDTTDSVPSISELSAAAPEPLPPTSDLVVTSSAPRERDLYQTGSDVIQLLPEVDSINETISVADLIIMQSSFDSKFYIW